MTKYELEEYMESIGFDLWATLRNNSYQFLSRDKNPNRVINCIVDLNTKSFEFKFLVPFTTFTLNSGKCSPIDYENHFNNIKKEFMKQVDIILGGNA